MALLCWRRWNVKGNYSREAKGNLPCSFALLPLSLKECNFSFLDRLVEK
jgi:hypothetical protein